MSEYFDNWRKDWHTVPEIEVKNFWENRKKDPVNVKWMGLEMENPFFAL